MKNRSQVTPQRIEKQHLILKLRLAMSAHRYDMIGVLAEHFRSINTKEEIDQDNSFKSERIRPSSIESLDLSRA